jgi:flagellar basal-body rod modification protein FlgD
MSTAVTAAPTDAYAALMAKTNGSAASSKSTQGTAENFLTMLVTQLKNQDPLNPMDNAQITSQMAQINAVTGLEKVNESVKALGTQFAQMQLLQGAALVGREVTLDGDLITFAGGKGRGAFDLATAAGAVKVEVLDINGAVVDTVDLGRRDAGRVAFQWDPGSRPTDTAYGFRVVAANDGRAVEARTLTVDRVQSISTAGGQLKLTLERYGQVAAADVVSFN